MPTDEEFQALLKKVEQINSKLNNLSIEISKIIEKGEVGKPPIQKKKKSIADLIMDLKVEGFFDQPNPVSNIVDALASRGYHYEPNSLTWTLQNLVRKGILGRIIVNRKWAYVKR
jgi:hypothetical protein